MYVGHIVQFVVLYDPRRLVSPAQGVNHVPYSHQETAREHKANLERPLCAKVDASLSSVQRFLVSFDHFQLAGRPFFVVRVRNHIADYAKVQKWL
jgi:hypothetical protein